MISISLPHIRSSPHVFYLLPLRGFVFLFSCQAVDADVAPLDLDLKSAGVFFAAAVAAGLSYCDLQLYNQ